MVYLKSLNVKQDACQRGKWLKLKLSRALRDLGVLSIDDAKLIVCAANAVVARTDVSRTGDTTQSTAISIEWRQIRVWLIAESMDLIVVQDFIDGYRFAISLGT
jgi:hypothetical protein